MGSFAVAFNVHEYPAQIHAKHVYFVLGQCLKHKPTCMLCTGYREGGDNEIIIMHMSTRDSVYRTPPPSLYLSLFLRFFVLPVFMSSIKFEINIKRYQEYYFFWKILYLKQVLTSLAELRD
jgi:hypothetical protein